MWNHALTKIILAAALLSVVHSQAQGNWPQWRGPDRTDRSPDTGLLKEWPSDGPKQEWVFEDAGMGYGGTAVSQGKVLCMGARGEKEFLTAVDEKSGKQVWSTEVGDLLKNNWGDGPRSTPTVDGDKIYALAGQGSLVCVSLNDGKILWEKKMQDLGGKVPGWGYTESVLVDGDKVVCTPGGDKGTMAALNKANGEVLWQSEGIKDPAQYSSVIVADHNGARQYIQVTMKHIFGVDAKDGKVLWQHDFPGITAVIPTPIFYEGHVYVTAGYGVGSTLIKIGENNEVKEVYFNKVMKNHHGGVVQVDKHVYGYSDGPGWVCQDIMTGAEVWADKKLGKGAITYADGKLFCLEEGSGTLVMIEASPKGWHELGRLKLDPQSTKRSRQGRIWTHPVITGGKLYLRDQEFLAAYNVKSGT